MNIQTTLAAVKELANIASDIDSENGATACNPNITVLAGKLHAAIEQMLGDKAHLVYAPDDGSEYDPRN